MDRRQFRRDSTLEIPAGAIVAEFGNGRLALDFIRMCLDRTYTVTAGINLPFAVRKICEHPIKHLRAVAGHSECGACGVALESDRNQAAAASSGAALLAPMPRGSLPNSLGTESADGSAPVTDARPAQEVPERGRGFVLTALTPKGEAMLPEVRRQISRIDISEDWA